ncbi:hypothetical protein ACOMHN_029696 [Nucella lapillus]
MSEGGCPQLSWTPLKVALCVALPVLVSLLLGGLLLSQITSPRECVKDTSWSGHKSPSARVTIEHTSSADIKTEDTSSSSMRPDGEGHQRSDGEGHQRSDGEGHHRSKGEGHQRSEGEGDQRSAPAVPITAERVVLHTLGPESSSLTGSLCGRHGCSGHYDDEVTDILVTADRRVVLTMWRRMSIVVKSSSGEKTIRLGCGPFSVTQLPSGLVAVTCPYTPAVLLVSLDSTDHQVQHIPTKKGYWRVAAHPVNDTLIAAAWPDSSIDVITPQGEVVRRLATSRGLSPGIIWSLTVVGEHLLVTRFGSEQIHRLNLTNSSQPLVESLAGSFPSAQMDTAVDEAGKVLVVLPDGGVMMRTPEGHIHPLRPGRADGRVYTWCSIALRDHRLLVVTVTYARDRPRSDVTEYRLVDE